MYLALANSGRLTISGIAKVSKINRGDIYRTLTRLQDLSLIEKIIVSPVQFESVPMEECLAHLIEQREFKSAEIKKKAAETVDKFKKRRQKCLSINDPVSQFIMLPEKIAKARICESMIAAKKSLDLVNTWRMRQLAFYSSSERRQNSLERGVHFRIITDRPPPEQSLNGVKTIKEYPNHELRYCEGEVTVPLGIFDNKEVYILTKPSTNSTEAPTLWSCHPSLVSIVQNYFDILWLTSATNPINKTNAL